jgi:hypothetical protein
MANDGVISGWWYVRWDARQVASRQGRSYVSLMLSNGGVGVYAMVDRVGIAGLPLPPPGWKSGRTSKSGQWRVWFAFRDVLPGSTVSASEHFVPLWVPLLLCAVPTVSLFRRPRSRPGQCACGYPREGLIATASCTECGQPAT